MYERTSEQWTSRPGRYCSATSASMSGTIGVLLRSSTSAIIVGMGCTPAASIEAAESGLLPRAGS